MKAITVTTDNIISMVEVKENGSPLYRQMNEAVGGHYENVYPRRLKQGFVMVVNEEGLLLDLPLNIIGSYLYESDKHGNPIVGNVIILKLGHFEGEPDVVGLTDDEANEIMNFLLKTLTNLEGANKND